MEQPGRSDRMRRRCDVFLSPDFARARVAPLLGGAEAGDVSVQLVRFHGTRVTLRYRFAAGPVVYGKVYRNGIGRARFATLRALWETGFSDDGPLRIAEPLGFLEPENIVCSREAQGIPLSRGLWECQPETAVARVRAAARWLAALHASPLSRLDTETPCARWRIIEESDILAEAAAARPEHASTLLEYLGCVHRLAVVSAAPAKLTPVHGQFIPSAIFVDAENVTVIDLDTLAVSDPASDVASFISRVRFRKLFNARVDAARAVRLASEFRLEYARAGAPRNLTNLPYYLALYCLKEFAKYIASPAADRSARNRAERLCRAELERCLSLGHTGRPVPPARRRSMQMAGLLRASGFGDDSPHRVPGFAPGSVNAIPLSTVLQAGERAEAVQGCRAAARWLAALHQSRVRVGKPEPEWVSLNLFRVPRRLIEIGARRPDSTVPLLEILHQLKRRLENLPAAGSLVQTHGSYHPGNVLVADGVTTVLGLDHSLPADPAKDVARFIAEVHASGLDGRYEPQTAVIAAGAFLEEYLSTAPGLDLAIRVGLYADCHRLLRLLDAA